MAWTAQQRLPGRERARRIPSSIDLENFAVEKRVGETPVHRESSRPASQRAREFESARARVRDVVRTEAARLDESADRYDEIVEGVTEPGGLEETAAIGEALLDPGLEASASLRPERRIIGERELERVRGTNAGASRGADLGLTSRCCAQIVG